VSEIPDQLALVGAFVNTLDVEEGTDELAQWLAARGPVGAADFDLALALRTALRAELTNHDGATGAELDRLVADLPMRARFAEDGVGLVPIGEGVRGALAEVVAEVVLAQRDGAWSRLKICREDTCQYAYYDWSKNSSKTWCGASCGNRNKTRAYRQRRIVGPARA
jgi:predicted RNA-binding Zn ribbon-like protein